MKDTAIPQKPFICGDGLLTVREQYEALLFSYKKEDPTILGRVFFLPVEPLQAPKGA